MSSPRVRLAAAAVVLMWASAFVGVRVALDELAPAQLALARYLVASVVFVGLLTFRRAWNVPPLVDLARLALAGGVGIALYNLALNTGQRTVAPGVASLFVNTVPVWTSLLAVLVLGERVPLRSWFGTGIAFAGVSILALQQGGWTGFSPGALLILGAAVAQAVYFVLTKPLLERYHPIEVTAWAVFFGTLLLAPALPNLVPALLRASSTTLGAVVFLGIGPAALAYLAWSYVLSRLPAGGASNYLFVVPVVTIALGWLILGDLPAPAALAGGLVSLTGVWISLRAVQKTAS